MVEQSPTRACNGGLFGFRLYFAKQGKNSETAVDDTPKT